MWERKEVRVWKVGGVGEQGGEGRMQRRGVAGSETERSLILYTQ